LSHSAPRPVRQQVDDIWEADLSLRLLLLFLLIVLFVAVPLAGLGVVDEWGDLMAATAFSLLGISGVLAVTRTRGARTFGLLAMTVPVGLSFYNALAPGHASGALRAALTVVALLWLALLALQHVFRAGTITAARLQGAIAVYLLLAVAFAELYWMLLQLRPEAFSFPHPVTTHGVVRANLFYFSVTTLTTLGYGDILPVTPEARSLATMEGLIGQLYPAVLIGRLVSLQGAGSQAEPRG
jgi:hypothetical protein